MNNLKYQKSLPRKRMGSGVLIFNQKNELLLVKTNYKNYWSLPDGVVNENESPQEACIRETKEEIDLDISPEFVCVHYKPALIEGTESLQFIFNAGKISNSLIDKIKINQNEISEYKFVELKDIPKLMSDNSSARLKEILDNKLDRGNKGIYLEGKLN